MDRYLILSMTSNVCYLSSDLVLMTLASWTFRTTTRGAYYYLKRRTGTLVSRTVLLLCLVDRNNVT
jgi:hypothetical protein